MSADSRQVVQEYAERADAAGNDWAKQLAKKVTHGLVPGEPTKAEKVVVPADLREWVPRVGSRCTWSVRGGASVPVTVVQADGEFTKVRLDDGREYWDLTVLLCPLVEP